MRLIDLGNVNLLVKDRRDLEQKLRWLETEKVISIPQWSLNLSHYEPPSNVSECYWKVRHAMEALYKEQIAAINQTLINLGVDIKEDK